MNVVARAKNAFEKMMASLEIPEGETEDDYLGAQSICEYLKADQMWDKGWSSLMVGRPIARPMKPKSVQDRAMKAFPLISSLGWSGLFPWMAAGSELFGCSGHGSIFLYTKDVAPRQTVSRHCVSSVAGGYGRPAHFETL